MKLNEKTWAFILAITCVIYVVLRFWNLTDSCLFFDEVFSVHAAEHTWGTLFNFVALDLIHPPFFYILLKIWIAVGGESLFWLRLFPVVFSIVALVLLILLCREFKLSFSTISLAVFFLAVNGALIKYAQEIRMYSPLLCLSLFSMWLFVRYVSSGKSYIWLILVNILLVNTHYYGWMVVLSEVVAGLVLYRSKLKEISIVLGASFLSFVPWIIAVYQATQTSANFNQNLGWAAKPDIFVVFQFFFDLVEPFYYQMTNVEPQSIVAVTVPLLVLIALAKILYLKNWKDTTEERKRLIIFLSIFFFVPILVAFTASWIFPVSIWGTRHLIIVFAPCAIAFAVFLAEQKSFRLIIVFISIFLFFTTLEFIVQIQRPDEKYIWCIWEELAVDLDRKTPSPKDANEKVKVYVFEDLVAYHFWFAVRNSDKFRIAAVKGIEGLQEDTSYFLPRGFDTVKVTDANGMTGDRFYIAFRDSKWNEYHEPLKDLLAKGYKIGEPQIIEAQGIQAFLVLVEK